jgi:hypothetical protein
MTSVNNWCCRDSISLFSIRELNAEFGAGILYDFMIVYKGGAVVRGTKGRPTGFLCRNG